MFKWLHHLFNPHCQQCKEDALCLNCNELRSMLESERFEKKQILDKLLGLVGVSKTEERVTNKELKPFGKPFIPWRMKQEMLEQSDRETAHANAEVKKQVILKDTSINELEEELGVTNASQ